MKKFKTIRDIIGESANESVVAKPIALGIEKGKVKGDVKYKTLGKFGDRNVIELLVVNGDKRAVAIRDFRRTAIILNVDEFKEMQKVMKRIKL